MKDIAVAPILGHPLCLQIFMIKHAVLNYLVYHLCTHLSPFSPRSHIAQSKTIHLCHQIALEKNCTNEKYPQKPWSILSHFLLMIQHDTLLQSFGSSEPELFLFLHVSQAFSCLLNALPFSIKELIMEHNICVTFVVWRQDFLHLVVWKWVEGAPKEQSHKTPIPGSSTIKKVTLNNRFFSLGLCFLFHKMKG